jgi:hypothetical protein
MIQVNAYKSFDYMRPALVTVIIFTIAGPPIGNLVLAALLPVFVFATGQETEILGVLERVPAIFRMFASSIPQSYVSGGLQAFATGLFLSGYGIYRGRPTVGIAAVLATIMWIGFVLFATSKDAYENTMMLLVHVFAAIICTWTSLRFWTRET